MRVVVDLQAAQSERLHNRGDFAVGLVRELAGRDVEVFVALNGALESSVDRLRGQLEESINRKNIRLWYPPAGADPGQGEDQALRRLGERLREGVITELAPDVLVEPTLLAHWHEGLVSGLGSMPEWFPVVAFAPGTDDAGVAARDKINEAFERLVHKQGQFPRIKFFIEIPGFTDISTYAPDIPEGRVSRLESASTEQASETILTLGKQAAGRRRVERGENSCADGKPKLAFVSPLPPEKTGIGYYSSELLPELAAYYDIDVVTDQNTILDGWVQKNCNVRSVNEFRCEGHTYDRVVYQFGNSRFHAHMWDLVKLIPGLVVVHDFYLGDAVHFREAQWGRALELPRELYEAHGYPGVMPLLSGEERSEAIRQFPASFTPFRKSLGAVVHSEHARNLVASWYGQEMAARTGVVPHPREIVEQTTEARRMARQRLSFPEDVLLVMSFGLVNKSKMPDRLLEAWIKSDLGNNSSARLVFVGEPSDPTAKSVQKRIKQLGLSERIAFTGWVEADSFQDYQLAADLAVQLRTNSRGETSGTVLDCMASGLPTICNAHGSFSELPEAAVWKLEDEFQDQDLADSLDRLAQDKERRHLLRNNALEYIRQHHHPQNSAKSYREALESAYAKPPPQRLKVVRTAVKHLPNQSLNTDLAATIGKALPEKTPVRQLFVDVSVVAREDLRTGVQRVVRSILGQLFKAETPGVRVEPVYTSPGPDGFLYARDFTQRFLGSENPILPDEPIEVGPGDIFLGLDLHTDGITAHERNLRDLRRRGVKIVFVVHDLLPVTHPQWFPKVEEQAFQEWLETITSFDGAICVSQATADDLRSWMQRNRERQPYPFQINVVHNGGDIESSAPTTGRPPDAEVVLERIGAAPSFLMVGTVEPRKGVEQALDAFEELWAQDYDVNLLVVGKQGWDVERLASRMRRHPEQGNRFFWITEASDEYLEHLYARSTCLLAASEAEGFGLPLIEAAKNGLPILARDIPVFREVAGGFADYFHAGKPKEFSQKILEWINRFREDKHTKSNGLPYCKWKEVGDSYIKILLR
jgi:glycosyltransferase involved in cell wall biosynthesis